MLIPVASIRNRKEFDSILSNGLYQESLLIENQLIDSSKNEVFNVNGFCVPCDTTVPFLVDMQAGGVWNASKYYPNWRERLECPLCRMNNRQRLISTLIKQELEKSDNLRKSIYFMEQPKLSDLVKTGTIRMI